MTPVTKVFDAFLQKITEDEWGYWTEEEVHEDLLAILTSARPWFKFPKVDLEITTDELSGETVLVGDLNYMEIQILSTYMKCEWLNRCLMSWENVKPLYEERDFSQANLIDKFRAMLEKEKTNALKLEQIYYRSIQSKPFDYNQMTLN